MSNFDTVKSFNDFYKRANKENSLELGKSLSESNVGKSFSLLSFGLSLNANRKKEYYKLYLNVVENWSHRLIELDRYEDVLKIYEVAQDIYPESPDLDYLLACTLYRIGKFREAWQYSIKALNACQRDPKARDLVSSLSSVLVDRWHFPMINDSRRNKKYKDAIWKCVSGGHTSALDIGAGSSLLSIYAKQAGCQKIYACEVDEHIVELGEEVLKLNGADGHIILLNKHSDDLQIPTDIPERVSLVITETFDAGLFGEHVLQTLQHAWNNLLLPLHDSLESTVKCLAGESVRVLPYGAEIWAAVIECDYIARQVKLINLDILNGKSVCLQLSEPYLSEKIGTVPGGFKLLTEWKQVFKINFNSLSDVNRILSGKIDETFSFIVHSEGRGDGIAIAYNLFLDAENTITTFPESDSCWESAVYPIYNLTSLIKNTELQVHMMYDGVLHFKLLEDFSLPSITTSDTQFLKCMNSFSYLKFYESAAKCTQENSRITVLDTCPFPQAGITLLKMNPKNRVFVNETVYNILQESRIEVYSATRKGQIDAVFYWPFTSEGTLKDNIFEELRSYSELLTKRGKIYPEFLDLQMLGIDSDVVARMTSVSDANTVGVKIAEVFNLTKTLHHLDIPIEGLTYFPVTPVLNPFRLDLREREAKIVLRGKEIRNELYKHYLKVGEPLMRSIHPFQTVSKGKINGFVYWFEMSNAGDALAPETSSGSESEARFETEAQNEFPRKASSQKDVPIFNSLSRDSPINQCILLLDRAHVVHNKHCLNLHFAISGGHFSVDVSSQCQ